MTPYFSQGVLPPLPPGGPFRPESDYPEMVVASFFIFSCLLGMPRAPGTPPGPPRKSPKTLSARLLPSLCFRSSSFPPSAPVPPLQGHRLGSPYATFTNKHNGFLTIPFPSQRVLTTRPGTQKITPGPPRASPGMKIRAPRRPGALPVVGQKRPGGVQNASAPQKIHDHH